VLQESKFELSKLENDLHRQMPKSTKKQKDKAADFTVEAYIIMG